MACIKQDFRDYHVKVTTPQLHLCISFVKLGLWMTLMVLVLVISLFHTTTKGTVAVPMMTAYK